jgi:hypothetical protein
MTGEQQKTDAKAQQPLWLDAVRRFERTIGVPIERAVTSDAYFDWLPVLRRSQEQMAKLVAEVTDEWFRLFNLPSGSDVRRMREQLSRMERQIETLTKQVADQAEAERRATPAAGTRKPRKPAPRPAAATPDDASS